ncbi:hypothetical protein DDIC_12375 [Desulfovibrio desulfuricans]|uniref:Uncharacterized protein n=1 Tax=Desulfovibrio desulfuricans TaxID=876 RepID=A0A4P7UNN4_DESDE|nr:DUF6765 family protein [Desulfovibrio desulfuricans]QCC86658.1 hypothetical protein DDIC_12375 [Desulfovibrio desulfuricans]
MQKDMHYFCTFAMARASGIPAVDANTVAYASQFVDDSTRYDSKVHEDGGLLFGITTAHSPLEALVRSPRDHLSKFEDQRKVWVPFHFFPGGKGTTFREKIICVKNGDLANEMFKNNLSVALTKDYCLELLGISSHVYADTFSHYGFSGMCSPYNRVDQDSLGEQYASKKGILSTLSHAYDVVKDCIIGGGAEKFTDALGHGPVSDLPDRPFEEWSFSYEVDCPSRDSDSSRKNYETYLEYCEKVYGYFMQFADKYYGAKCLIPFEEMRTELVGLLQYKGELEEREAYWKASGLTAGVADYDPEEWENDKKRFVYRNSSSDGIATHAYRFHQAAAYHRYHVLKDMLPSRGIAVY